MMMIIYILNISYLQLKKLSFINMTCISVNQLLFTCVLFLLLSIDFNSEYKYTLAL